MHPHWELVGLCEASNDILTFSGSLWRFHRRESNPCKLQVQRKTHRTTDAVDPAESVANENKAVQHEPENVYRMIEIAI